MNNKVPTFTDISDCSLNVYQCVGGTRNKQIVIYPDNNVKYFFKGSKILKDTKTNKIPN